MAKRGEAKTILLMTTALACGLASAANAQMSPEPPQVERPVEFSLPVIFRGRVLGQVLVRLRGGQAEVDAADLINLLSPSLTEEGRDALMRAFPPGAFADPLSLSGYGVEATYDPARLEVFVVEIKPGIAASVPLIDFGASSALPVTLEPERTSGYLNVLPELVVDQDGEISAAADLFAAFRVGNFVFETDGGYDDGDGIGPGLYRTQSRLVWDRPDQLRRYSLGDLRTPATGLLGSAFIGGVSIESGRRIFNPFLPAASLGGQRYLIDSRATVEVYSNGTLVDSLQVDPGAYDISQLATRYGATNIELFVVDGAGRRQGIQIDGFFDRVDLQQGETEFSVAAGVLADAFSFSPSYSDEPAVAATYRRGLSSRLVVGGGFQGTSDLQTVSVEGVYNLRRLPARAEAAIAVSSNGGAAARAALFYFDIGKLNPTAWSLSATHETESFRVLGDVLSVGDFAETTVNGSYSRAINDRLTVLGGLTYTNIRPGGEFSLATVEGRYRLSARTQLRAGLQYGQRSSGEREFGAGVSLTMFFGNGARLNARYDSVGNNAGVSYSRSPRNHVGSYGYDLIASRAEGRANVDASAVYIGNRFDVRGSFTSAGTGFDDISRDQQFRLNVGSSVAYAGGLFAWGRPINDSFLIAKPARGLDDTRVVVGDYLQENRYEAVSGPFGPALQPQLSSFSNQSVRYDLEGRFEVSDVGAGIETVLPPYRSGYRLTVGSDATSSVVGTLFIDGVPAALVAGSVVQIDDPDFERDVFFTNSVGRFAVVGLRPGRTYEVRIPTSSVIYRFTTGDRDQPLNRLGDVAVTSGAK